MATILGIGVATLDIINTTDGFPNEDSKVRALSQRINRGGNVCNTLTVLNQLGHTCSWCGTLGDDTAALHVRADLDKQHIDISNCHTMINGHTPTSYICLNKLNGSRTIVHYRDLPELTFEHFAQLDLSHVDCCHFEGRNIVQQLKMISHLKQNHPEILISVEIEKPRIDIEQLFSNPDILFFSREYIQYNRHVSADYFLNSPNIAKLRDHSILVCTWGDQGAWLTSPGEAAIHHQAAINVSNLVDTIGAGDTFIAGFLHQWLLDKDPQQAVKFATTLASQKCSQSGFDDVVINLVKT